MKKFFLLIFLLFFAASVYSANKEVIVKLKDKTVSPTTIVKLKNIGMVIGDKRLENLIIVKFNEGRESFLLNKQFVYNKILNFYISKKENPPKIVLISHNAIKILRKTYFLTSETIQSLIKKFLRTNKEKIFKHKEYKIIKIISPEKIRIPEKNIDIRISLLSEKNCQRLPFLLTLINHQKVVKEVRVLAITEVKGKYVVAKRRIFLRKILTPDDVEVKDVPLTSMKGNYFTSLKDVLGKITTRYIRAGEPISSDMIKEPPMVKRGEIVDVIAKGEGIVITTKAKALENGYFNKNIRVLNMSSGKVFDGTVVGYGKVRVIF